MQDYTGENLAMRLNIFSACCTGTWEHSRAQRDQVLLRFPEALPTGHGVLKLQFHYTLLPGLSGFYLASSKCESVRHARRTWLPHQQGALLQLDGSTQPQWLTSFMPCST